jgi:fructose-1,6-bisphosphatase/sedoheptulose 1,7-bisphosphatase-like protein
VAVSAARLRGHGNKIAADQVAVDAMRRELNKMSIDGTVVIGEGEQDKAPDVYMQKISIGPGYAKGVVDLDEPLRTIFVAWPRRKVSGLRRSRRWSWIVRGMQRLMPRCAAPAPPWA